MRVLLLQALSEFIGPAVLFQMAVQHRNLVQRPGVLDLVFAVEHVGVQIGEQGLLRLIGGAEAVAQGVVCRRLIGIVLRWRCLDHLTQERLGLGEVLQGRQALGLGELRQRNRSEPFGEEAIRLSSSTIASLCLFCLAKSFVRSTAAISAPLGSLASEAMAASALAKSPEANWIRARHGAAPKLWRLLG